MVIAGEGEAADAKARLFDGSPARLVRIAGPAALEPGAYGGASLAFIAGEEGFCRAAAAAAKAAGALVNAVDRPELCDFNSPGIVDRGAVVGAIGSVGAAPVLVVRLRQELEARWPAHLGRLARLMAALRPAIREAAPDWSARRRLLGALMQGPWAEAALAGDLAGAKGLARAALAEGRLETSPGGVTLVQAPAEPDLVTLRAMRALAAADRLWLAGDVAPDILAHARRDAPRASWTGPPPSGWEGLEVVVGEVEALAGEFEAQGIAFSRV